MSQIKQRVVFTLEMPSDPEWGRDRAYQVVRYVDKARVAELMKMRTFPYRFADGWTALVTMTPIEPRVRAPQVSGRFADYDWMIDSILVHGEITAEPKPRGAAADRKPKT